MDKLDTALKATSYNVGLQVALRASSFIMNAIVLRYIQAELLGVVNLRLTLLYNTVLFVSREAIRKARLTKGNNMELWSHSLNISWIPVPLGILSSIALALVWLNPFIEQPSVVGDSYGVLIFSLAAIIELCAEPMWLLGQEYQHVILKVFAEGIPQLVKCTIVVVGVVLCSYSGLTVFLLAQLVYSLLYVAIYYVYFYYELQRPSAAMPVKRLTGLLPHTSSTQGLFGPNLPSLTWTFFKQSFLKQMLTDGEKYVMTIFGVLSFAEQGVYDTINNLGSLVARFIFLPIEESFYVYFSTSLYRGVLIKEQPKKVVPEASNALSMILKVVLVIAITIVTFGYSYAHLALDIYGGSLLVDGGGVSLLRWYCFYVLLLAVNGVTECFVFAVMSEEQVNRYNRTLMLFSAVFLAASLFLSRLLGGVGFILANCVNMLTRVGHSCHFIRTYFSLHSDRPLLKALPSVPTFIGFAVVAVLASLSERQFCCDLGWTYRFVHIFIGAVLLMLMGMVVGINEPDLFDFVGRKMTGLVVPRQRLKIKKSS